MNIRIGSGPDSWGVWFADDPKQPPWQRFLDEVAEAGYEWIELGPYGYLPTDASKLRPELERRKLKVSGTFLLAHLEEPSAWPELEKQLLGAGELLATLGAKFLVLIDDMHTDWHTGERIKPERLAPDAWKRLIETTNRVADIAKDRFNLTLVFHPSPDTHVAYEDQIEAFLQQTDPRRVSMALDVGHNMYRGGDPVKLIRQFHERMPYLHFKSINPEVREKVVSENIPFAKAVQMGIFCELSKGVVNFPALRELLMEINYDGWAIVEQDMYPAQFDKLLPIAKRNREYLQQIGMG